MQQVSTRTSHWRRLALVAGLAAALLAGAVAPASAVNATTAAASSATNPADWTPQVMDGSVKGIVQIGNRIVAVGTFTRVRQALDQRRRRPQRLFAFDATTGVIDPGFNPNLGGQRQLASTPTAPTSTWAARSARSAGNTAIKRVARLTAAGAVVPGLNGPERRRERGRRARQPGLHRRGFTSVVRHRTPRAALAALDTTTGAVLPGVRAVHRHLQRRQHPITRFDARPRRHQARRDRQLRHRRRPAAQQIAVLDTPAGATAASSTLGDRPLRRAHTTAAPRSSTPSSATSTSRPTAPTSPSPPPARSPAARAAGPCATPSTRWETTTGTGNDPTWVGLHRRRHDATASPSPAARSTSAATCAGRTTPSRATRPVPAPCRARASPPSTRSTACRCRGTRAARAAWAPRRCSPPPQGSGSAATPTRIGGETPPAASPSCRWPGGSTLPTVTGAHPARRPLPRRAHERREQRRAATGSTPAVAAVLSRRRRSRLVRRRPRHRRQRRRLGHDACRSTPPSRPARRPSSSPPSTGRAGLGLPGRGRAAGHGPALLRQPVRRHRSAVGQRVFDVLVEGARCSTTSTSSRPPGTGAAPCASSP